MSGNTLHAGETIRVQEKLQMRINSPARDVVSSTIRICVYIYINEQWTCRSVSRFDVRERIASVQIVVSSNFEFNFSRILVAR